MSKNFSYLSKMQNKEKKLPLSKAFKDLHQPIEHVYLPYDLKTKLSSLSCGVCASSPFYINDKEVSFTTVSNDFSLQSYNYLVSTALNLLLSNYLSKKFKDNPEFLKQFIEDLKE